MRVVFNRRNLQGHVATRCAGRYAINGIQFREDGTWSCDGTALLCVPYPREEIDDMPECLVSDSAYDDGAPILPVSTAERLAKIAPNPNGGRSCGVLSSAGEKIEVRMGEHDDVMTTKARSIEGVFPEVDRAMNKALSASGPTVRLSLAVLKKLVCVLEKIGCENVAFRPQSGEGDAAGPILFVGEGGAWQEGCPAPRGALMPIAID